MFYLKVVPVISGHLVNNWRSLRHCSVYKQTSRNLHLPVFVLLNICWRLHGLFQSCSKVEYQRDNLHWRFQKPSCFSRNQKAGCQTRNNKERTRKSFEGKQLCFPSTRQPLFLQKSIESCSPAAQLATSLIHFAAFLSLNLWMLMSPYSWYSKMHQANHMEQFLLRGDLHQT